MAISAEQVLEALTYVIEPELKKDVVSANLVSNLQIDGNKVSFELKVHSPAMHYRKRMEEACQHNIMRFLGGDVSVDVKTVALGDNKDREPEQRTVLPKVKKIIAIASGKGGVGKSTISANLAAGLAKKGKKVGLLDADIYGPSGPIMFDMLGEKPKPAHEDGKDMIGPVENHGVKVMSIGFFAGVDDAIVWRGPMATKALRQMIEDVAWGELDYMFIDLPPGTGDIHLTMVSALPLDGAVIVSTPQNVALIDARKAVSMFRMDNIKVPVLGIVENMAWFTPPDAPDKKYHIFGTEGASQLAERMEIPLLGQIPLVQSIREAGDAGRPAVLQSGTVLEEAFMNLVEAVEGV